METILANGISWLTKHVPGLALIVLLVTVIAWAAVKINDFDHRLSETERVCSDINLRQLPEMRTEMRTDIKLINERLQHMELQLNTIITYIETKDGSKSKFP